MLTSQVSGRHEGGLREGRFLLGRLTAWLPMSRELQASRKVKETSLVPTNRGGTAAKGAVMNAAPCRLRVLRQCAAKTVGHPFDN